jgi:hypothetical protein
VTASETLDRHRAVETGSRPALTLAGGERDDVAPGSAVRAIAGSAQVDMAVARRGL